MSHFQIVVDGGKTVRLPTAGKYCDRDILVAGKGGDTYSEGYEKGHTEGLAHGIEQGKQAEYDRFWDSLQNNGTRTNYPGAFGSIWNDENFKPKYDIRPVDATTMFEYSGIVDLKGDMERAGVVLDFSRVTHGRFVQIFQNSQITRVGVIDTTGSKAYTTSYMFMGATKLREIEAWVMTDDGTQKFNETNTFQQCAALEEIRIVGLLGCSMSFSACSLLSNDSVQSIIDHLKDLTGATSQKLTFHATVGAKLTEAQKAVITAKNWTLVY